MTNPELITDEIVEKALNAVGYFAGFSQYLTHEILKASILAIQDDITRPVYNILRGYKQDAEAYEMVLRNIRLYGDALSSSNADKALKGDYHKTDFTEYCEHNPITEEL